MQDILVRTDIGAVEEAFAGQDSYLNLYLGWIGKNSNVCEFRNWLNQKKLGSMLSPWSLKLLPFYLYSHNKVVFWFGVVLQIPCE